MFRMLVQGVTDYAIYMLDPDGSVTNWNMGAQRIKGYLAEEVVGKHFARFYTREDRAARLPGRALAIARETGHFEAEGWRVRKDGSRFWANAIIEAIRDDRGHLLGFAKVTRDITDKKADTDKIRDVSRILDLALSNMSQGLCLFDEDWRLRLVNNRFLEIFGIAGRALPIGTSLRGMWKRVGVASQGDTAWLRSAGAVMLRRHERMIQSGQCETLVDRLASGKIIATTYRSVDTGGFVVTFDNVTTQKEAEAEIARLAHTDALTGLANRAFFWGQLSKLCVLRPETHNLALLFIDLDGFKSVNDTLGHRVGDLVLCQVAERLRGAVRCEDLIARFGGDEFAVLLTAAVKDEANTLAQRLVNLLSEPYDFGGTRVRQISASIGIAVTADPLPSPDRLFAEADDALYRAKRNGKAAWRVFAAEAGANRLEIEQGLQVAIAAGQLHVHYQPIVNLQTGRVTTCEALLRWQHPMLGWITPDRFIPIAEQTGLVRSIGYWMLARACRDAAASPDGARVAVNVSPCQLGGGCLPDQVLQVLLETGLPPRRLELEITETALLSGDIGTLTDLRRIQAMGVRIALDDFGVGFSSLAHLRTFPFDRIKIDGSFVRDAVLRPDCRAIVGTIAGLGLRLGVETVAEGVETPEQLALARDEGCTEVQGYLFARPAAISAETFDGLRSVELDCAPDGRASVPGTVAGLPVTALADDIRHRRQ